MERDKNELLKKYFGVIGKVEELGIKFEEKGYSDEQVTDIISLLAQEVPGIFFSEEDLKVIVHELQLKEMTFDEIEEEVERNKNFKL